MLFISLRFLELAFICFHFSKITISLRFWCDPSNWHEICKRLKPKAFSNKLKKILCLKIILTFYCPFILQFFGFSVAVNLQKLRVITTIYIIAVKKHKNVGSTYKFSSSKFYLQPRGFFQDLSKGWKHHHTLVLKK